ncbi:MAG: translation elongation factor Ts [Betaproteobacteria bacterium RIFCSPLOWO2_02_FULL_65_24]|nr:MAG: translation elongation factor Ts [Betaproteobacteria bacterium RIFCSPLOWO2_02_FULL_65_24]OGA87127.1 MAG: translation elongation factor Ts [Betaproteobacteria bacterium RIFCSPLOWO2_12_FULL_66_14]
MAEITASMVKELRAKTDAPMMECKKALSEAGGDLAKAEEILRIKLGNRASRAATRIAAEGLVGLRVSPDAKRGAMVELNCETDFVAKNPDFIAFAGELAKLVVEANPVDVQALSAMRHAGGSSVEEVRGALIGRIGENITIRRFARLEATGRLAQYVHGGAKIATLVDYSGGDEQLGRDLAMQVAATRPVALSAAEVPQELVRKERDIAAAKAAESGKPANIVEKMVDGAVQKYLKEVTLLGQPFVKDDKQTVQALLKAKGARVSKFVLFVVGEGIEKKSSDFAAEVMAQAGMAAKA